MFVVSVDDEVENRKGESGTVEKGRFTQNVGKSLILVYSPVSTFDKE